MGIFIRRANKAIRRNGYLGVGCLQNLEYISRVPHTYAVLVDMSHATLDFLRAIFSKIANTCSQTDFLQWWCDQKDRHYIIYLERAKRYRAKNWLLNADLYKTIRQSILTGNIRLIHGDLADTAIQNIIMDDVTKHGAPITTIYLSNILSTYGRTEGYYLNYTGMKRLLKLAYLVHDAECILTLEFMPEEYRLGFYHYSSCSLSALRDVMERNGNIDQFLAYYLAMVIGNGNKTTSRFIAIPDIEQLRTNAQLSKRAEKFTEDSDDWPIWKNFQKNFLSRK